MKEKIKMIAFVLILGSILTGSLLAVDNWTMPIIEKNQVLKTKRSILAAFEIAFELENTEKAFAENIKLIEKDGHNFYQSLDGAVAFEFSGSGLWGPIEGIMAVLPDHQTLQGITIIHQEETPGLGSRIADKEYLDMFKNKKLLPAISITAPGKKAEGDNQVDGITGATLSCNAFTVILNSEAAKYLPMLEGIE